MTPESIPEDKEQSFPCDESPCTGSIVLINNEWQCTVCLRKN
jgi:hypothetical protein